MKDRAERLETQIEDLDYLVAATQLELTKAKEMETQAIKAQLVAKSIQRSCEAQIRSFEFRIQDHEEELAELTKNKSHIKGGGSAKS